jgi:heme oxygenase
LQVPVELSASFVDQLEEATRDHRVELDTDAHDVLGPGTRTGYRQFLSRVFGLVAPLERSLIDTNGLDRALDHRRLRKSGLLANDLEALGMSRSEIQSLPQCMSIPWFDEVPEALGWAYIVERMTLGHASMYRHLATVIPGEIAFASSYLKCYFGSVADMWRSFGQTLDREAKDPAHAARLIDAAKAGYRHYRRWRHTLDGKAISGTRELREGDDLSIMDAPHRPSTSDDDP